MSRGEELEIVDDEVFLYECCINFNWMFKIIVKKEKFRLLKI